MPLIQEAIHKLEVAGGMRPLRIALSVLAVLAMITLYNFRAYHNMSNQEAMDAAQLARNISQGKGYTTDFIRPFSMFLLKKNNEAQAVAGRLSELAMIKGPHPDITNPPAYPVVLAVLMKLLPLDFSMPLNRSFWGNGGNFWRFQPDFIIAIFNELLFLGAVVLLFFLARRLFDPLTAWISAGIFFGTETFWRFSISGLSTMLLVFIFLGLVWTLLLIEEQCRNADSRKVWAVLLALASGLLVGLGCLTRYSFGWLIIPVLAFLLFFSGSRKAALLPSAFVAFALVVTPWIVRNFSVSDTPLGTSGYSIYQDSGLFPEDMLERSLDPNFTRGRINAVTQKFLLNSRQIIQEQVPRLSGNWLGAFFVVGRNLRKIARQHVAGRVRPRPVRARRSKPPARDQHVPEIVVALVDEDVGRRVRRVRERSIRNVHERGFAVERDQLRRLRADEDLRQLAAREEILHRVGGLVHEVDDLALLGGRANLLERFRHLERSGPRTRERERRNPAAGEREIETPVRLHEQGARVDDALDAARP